MPKPSEAFPVSCSDRPLIRRLAVTCALVAAATGIRYAMNPLLGDDLPWLIFYPAVLLAAWYGRLVAGLVATSLTCWIAFLLWLKPTLDNRILTLAEWTSVLTFAAMSVLISILAESGHRAAVAEKAQRCEREKERRFFESALGSITDAVIVVDEQWRCTYLNGVAAGMIGRPRDEITGRDFWELFPSIREDDFYRQVCRSRDEMVPVRFEYRHAGSNRWVEVRACPMDGHTAIYQMDISDRKNVEADLLAAQRTLKEHAETLEFLVAERTRKLQDTIAELERFSYTISHDLRAPLRALESFSRFVVEDYGDKLDAEGLDYLERIRAAARRMDELINDVLIYSRTSRADLVMKPVDLDRLVRDIVSQYPWLKDSAANIEVRSPLGEVLGNETMLTQIISNLLSNAVKFVAPGQSPAVEIRTETRPDHIVLIVQDRGIGIPDSHRKKIFGMFERAHDGAYEGTGVGLAIVKRASERMNGSVTFEPTPGGGSTFYVELPVPDDGAR